MRKLLSTFDDELDDLTFPFPFGNHHQRQRRRRDGQQVQFYQVNGKTVKHAAAHARSDVAQFVDKRARRVRHAA